MKPYPAYKDSGVKWLDVVPTGWAELPLKRIVTMKSGDSITSDDIEEIGPFPVFGGNGLRGFTDRYTHEGMHALVGRQGALCGNVNVATGRFFASEHAVVVDPLTGTNVDWLARLLGPDRNLVGVSRVLGCHEGDGIKSAVEVRGGAGSPR